MSKQPYIPLYTGDYLKKTRILPLAVRSVYVELQVAMWDNPVRGEIIGTIEEYTRLIGCSQSEADFALNLLKQKGTYEIILLTSGQIKVIDPEMKKAIDISSKRSSAGKKAHSQKFALAKDQANADTKTVANTGIDNGIGNDTDSEQGEVQEREKQKGKGAVMLDLAGALDAMTIDEMKAMGAYRGLDIEDQKLMFNQKVSDSWEDYTDHGVSGLRKAFNSQLRTAKEKLNRQPIPKNYVYQKPEGTNANAIIQPVAGSGFKSI